MIRAEESINGNHEDQPLTWMFWKKRRYIVVLLAHLGYLSSYSLRVNLSVAIVEMTKNRTVEYANGTVGFEQYFDWTPQQRGIILSSFFWGYICTQFVGGFFGKRFGGNLIFGLGIGLTAILSILTPWLGRTVTAMVVIRVLQGLFEGVTFPCILHTWLYWAPVQEQSRMTSIAYAGMFIGTVLTMPISALLATSFGWESIFYVFGVFGVLWHIVWSLVVRTSPDKDPFISKGELDYIQSNMSLVDDNKKRIPWRAILRSKPVYAITASHIATNWGYYTMITQMPMFLADTLHYDLGSSGFMSAAPYLTMGILISVAGYLSDLLQNKGHLTTTQVRKYFNCGAFVVQFICLLMAGFLVDRVWSVVLIIIGVGSGGFASAAFPVNPLDIAPAFASVVLGFSNTFATIPGIISPVLSGYLVQNQTVDEWRSVFYITAGIYVIGCFIYWCWCSGQLQPWAISKSDDDVVDRQQDTTKISNF